MKTYLSIFTLFGLFFFTAVGGVSVADKPEVAAQAAAEKWLALIDAEKYGDSWQTSAELFQKAVTQASWEQAVKSVRAPLGALVSRKLKSANYAKSLPGAPDGEYVVLQFDTEFANKKTAVETVTPMLGKDGAWKVSGYYVK